MALTRPLISIVAVALIALALVALLPDCAYACSCAMSPGSQQEIAKQALSDSAAVFSGEVLAIEERLRTSAEGMVEEGSGSTVVTLRVSEVWKGPERGTVEVSTPSSEAACGYSFEEGREYLVYAGQGFKEEEGRTLPDLKKSVDICSQTKPLSDADADLQALGEGQRPGGGQPLPDTSGGVAGLGVVALAGVAATATFLLLRQLLKSR